MALPQPCRLPPAPATLPRPGPQGQRPQGTGGSSSAAPPAHRPSRMHPSSVHASTAPGLPAAQEHLMGREAAAQPRPCHLWCSARTPQRRAVPAQPPQRCLHRRVPRPEREPALGWAGLGCAQGWGSPGAGRTQCAEPQCKAWGLHEASPQGRCRAPRWPFGAGGRSAWAQHKRDFPAKADGGGGKQARERPLIS